jgi:hypothetical protein
MPQAGGGRSELPPTTQFTEPRPWALRQAFLVVVIIGHVMPFFGLELLDTARDVAAFDLPARVGQLLGSVCSGPAERAGDRWIYHRFRAA